MAAASVVAPMSPSHSAHDQIHVKMEDAVKEVLTPPASEENNKRARSNSDLTDLNLDSSDDSEIEPDHYYEGGKIPIFKPTMEQFKDFRKFIDKVDKYGMKSGIVKVVPPPEWKASLPQLDEMIKTIKVKNPITQEFHGSQGTWTQANMEKQRTYNLPQWRALCEESNHQPPARRGERRRNQERTSRASTARAAKSPAAPAAPGGRRPRGRPRKTPLPTLIEAKESSVDPETQSQGTPVPESPVSKKSKTAAAEGESDEEITPSKPRGRQPKSVSSRRLRNKGEQADVIDEEAFKDFDYRIHDQDQWTAERCKELEVNYWKSLTFNNPMYGADMPGSLFTDETTSWNVAKLPNLLDVLGQKVPGVNTAYLYLGMWKATFAWHLEDVDLYSINYIHFGAPKQWYSISQEDARRFEAAMKSIWPTDAKNCDQFLRHKTYLISPTLLKSQFNIEVNRLVHNEGEFVITYPYGYHSGYNLGYNCAESVNFANEAWLEYGKVAKKCNCEADSVWIDVEDIERKLRGDQSPEYYEETEEDDEEDEEDEEATTSLPTPPGSVKGQPKARGKKRKRGSDEKGDKTKVKKIRIRISAPTKEPCCLCPYDLPFEGMLPTDTGVKAHRRCANYTPETRVIELQGVETVIDVATIDKARLDLKCNHCRSKRGSVFQCSQKKCTRAYHATCAAAAGVQVDSGLVPVFLEDGSEYTELGHDFRCRFHRAKRPKFADTTQHAGLQLCINALEGDPLITRSASKLKRGDLVQAQYYLGDIFGGYVLENRKSEETVLLEVGPKKEKVEVEYKWILVLDPSQSQLPKPSANAQPLPTHLFTSAKTNEDPASEVPKVDDAFDIGSSLKWAEFHTSKPFHNPSTVKVDISKPKSLWFYLGATSTEAKAQYTDNLANRQHDPSSNFLDIVRPPPVRPAQRQSVPAAYPSGVNTNSLNAVRTKLHLQPPKPAFHGPRPMQHNSPPQTSTSPAAHVDVEALRNQQAFLHSASGTRTPQQHVPHAKLQKGVTMPETTLEGGNKAPGLKMGELRRRSSQPSVDMDGVHPCTQDSFQSLKLAGPPARTGQAGLSVNPSPSQKNPGHADTMSPPNRPVFSRSPSAQTVPKSNLLTPPSTSDSGNGQRSRSDSLIKILTKWPFLQESHTKCASMHRSPYASEGGYTDAAFVSDISQLAVPTPANRSRSTSLMQAFLERASPRQREAVRGHTRTISTDKAAAKAREAERRMSESIQRQQRMTGGAMSPIEMMPEGILGDFGRPSSSSAISDRASPFPDFGIASSSSSSTVAAAASYPHGHPVSQPSSTNEPPVSTISLSALNTAATKSCPDAPELPPALDLQSANLANLHYPRPTTTLNRHMPHVYYSSEQDFTRQLEEAAARYPMGTVRPSSYNNYMRDLEAGSTANPLICEEVEGQAARIVPGDPRHPVLKDSSWWPVHGYRSMAPSSSGSEVKKGVEREADVELGQHGHRGPVQAQATTESPLRETSGRGGGEMLPMMNQDIF